MYDLLNMDLLISMVKVGKFIQDIWAIYYKSSKLNVEAILGRIPLLNYNNYLLGDQLAVWSL